MEGLQLRGDLEIIPRITVDGDLQYLIKDPRSNEIFGLSEKDYFIVNHISGGTSLASVQASFQARFDMSLPLERIEAFVRYLNALGLLESLAGKRGERPQYSAPAKVRHFGDPNRFFQIVTPWFGWCFSWFWAMLSGIVCLMAAGIAVKFGDDLLYDLQTVWQDGMIVAYVMVGVLISSFFEEVAKGTVCRHYGGSVHECGLMDIFNVFPRFYCDLSDVSWMPDKGKRLCIFSAGIVFQLLMLSVSIIMWKKSIPSTNMSSFWLIMIVIFSWAIFINANPLHTRDGYLLLVTWFKEPDLKTRAALVTKARILRKPLPEPLSSRQVRWFTWYTILSACFIFWLMVTLLSIFGYVLITNLEGFGACVFAFILYRFLGSLKSLRLKKNTGEPKLIDS